MGNLATVLADIEEQVTVSTSSMRSIASHFKEAMIEGLSGKQSSLKMLPSYIGSPTGKEQGRVVAVDFGGTKVRVLLIELGGQGQAKIIDRRSFPLRDKLANYDYTAASTPGVALFDFIAGKITEIVPVDAIYPLGHTFSFPCQQHGVNEAVLISWTKEIKTAGVEGQDVGELLQAALKCKGYGHVILQAVINDTTGTLLAAAYADRATDIGTICGTGHNSCYLEPCHPLTHQPMVINMESGNFDGVLQTSYDRLLDQASEKVGAQPLEKMASGQYLGEIVRIIVSSLVADRHIAGNLDMFTIPYSLPTEDISIILADTTSELCAVANVAATRLGIGSLKVSELAAIQTVARLVAVRSARLVAATWAGVLFKIDPDINRRHNIAVDGSLYEKMPGYAEHLAKAMSELLGSKANQVTIRLSKDGSGIGAAIAAAIIYNAK